MTLYVCSTNTGKLRDFKLAARQAKRSDIEISPLPQLREISAPAEDGTTFAENAAAKALYYSNYSEEAVLADDSGLEVEALHGAPGVYSARYAGPGASDEDNNNALLRDLGNQSHREARFVCVLALALRGHVLMTAQGAVEGEVLEAPRGNGGFGYDPLFFYRPLRRSFGELSLEEKFSVSHRGRAFHALLARLPELWEPLGGSK